MKTKTITIKTPNNTHIRDKHIKSRISSIDRTADREGIYMSDPLHRMVCHPQRVLLRMFLSYKLSVFFQSHPVCPLALLIFPADGCRAVVESCVQHVYDGLLCSNERKAKRSEETFPTKAKKRTNQIDAYRTDPTPTRNDTHTHTHTHTHRAHAFMVSSTTCVINYSSIASDCFSSWCSCSLLFSSTPHPLGHTATHELRRTKTTHSTERLKSIYLC